MPQDAPEDQFAAIARSMSHEPSVATTVASATAAALELVTQCDHACISLVGSGGKIATVAATDDIATRADELQYTTSQGPCLQSIAEQETVYSPDLRSEERWPLWASAAAADLGVRSVLALQLFIADDAMGSLNLYSDTPHAFAMEDRVTALALAAHVAVAFSAARSEESLESALVHRTTIGNAQGMLMQGLRITPDQAFAAMVRVSQARNLKLHLVAADIVQNGIRAEMFD